MYRQEEQEEDEEEEEPEPVVKAPGVRIHAYLHACIHSEFRDVVFEDVVFDNNRCCQN